MSTWTSIAEDPGSTDTRLPSAVPPGGVPIPLTTFVGRERELGELRGELARTRLLTLTGTGGCGKTRLALQLACELVDRFPGGVSWVDVTPVADARLVGAAIGEALGVRPLPGVSDLQACGAYLAPRRALVILDNCEHLLGACAEAAETLLRAGGEVVVLATSRAPLSAGGETIWRVPSLSLPAKVVSAETLADSDAASLFVERARNARPGWELTDPAALAVALICEALDGMPLAIELAAARLRMLSVEQIAAGVSDRFRLLTGGPRTAVARQRTWRASVDWSYELLAADERVLLRRLAVFVGGFALDAVENICAGEGIEAEHVLDLLGSLVDQSLVVPEERAGGVRFRLLETVRQYSLERLTQAGEADALRARHCEVFLALAERAGAHFESPEQRAWLERVDPEAANLAAAIDHALAGESSLALRFCVALERWWNARGRFAEAELALARSLEACAHREPALRARALVTRTGLAVGRGAYEAGEAHATEALALADELGDVRAAARARCHIGHAREVTNPRGARADLARAAELAQAAGDDWAFVTAKQWTACSYLFLFENAQAARANDEVAALAERVGDPALVGRRWLWKVMMAMHDGRLSEARDAVERTRAAYEGVGSPPQVGLAEYGLAFVETMQGAAERALERLETQLEAAIKAGAGLVVPFLLEGIATAELAAGRLASARRRLEALQQLLDGRDSYVTWRALGLLAEAQRLSGDEAAEATARQAQAGSERFGNRFLGTLAGLTRARLAAARGDWSVAQQHTLAHLDVCATGGHATYIPSCLDALGEVAAGLGEHEDAARLLAAADRAREQLGVVRIPKEARHWDAIHRRLRETLGNDAYDTAYAQGVELSIDDALEWARRGRGPRRRSHSGWQSLTPTEAKVAELVSEGLTNPQIGQRMFISAGTVKTHVAHIFRKLDVHSRAELTAHAVRRNRTS
jgi:predicted ATPase/DNA-binding CsgD family transcriptional regulator